jgi:hypothetical protein
MRIEKVLSYLGAWNKINHSYSLELSEIVSAATQFYSGRIQLEDEEDSRQRYDSKWHWDKAFIEVGWSPQSFIKIFSPDGKSIRISSIGPMKNGLCAQRNYGADSELSRWLFRQVTLAVRHGVVEIPVLVSRVRDSDRTEENRIYPRVGHLSSFENIKSQLDVLTPLNFPFPFLILGLSRGVSPLPDLTVTELESDPNVVTDRIVIDRCIEFPPEFYQAGIGILSSFGTYLRDNYPDRHAKVRIEQKDHMVRMIVETADGNVTTVEQALRDYEMIFTGKVMPEAISTNDKVVLDLRNELRIAQFRIESQQDIINMQNNRMDKLMDLIGNGLNAAQSRPISLHLAPTFNNSNSFSTNPSISSALEDVNELLNSIPPEYRGSEADTTLEDIGKSLEEVECESDSAKISKSSGIMKLGGFLDRLVKGNEELNKVINSIEKGRNLVSSLIRTYNKFALLGGLPPIPFI